MPYLQKRPVVQKLQHMFSFIIFSHFTRYYQAARIAVDILHLNPCFTFFTPFSYHYTIILFNICTTIRFKIFSIIKLVVFCFVCSLKDVCVCFDEEESQNCFSAKRHALNSRFSLASLIMVIHHTTPILNLDILRKKEQNPLSIG